VKSIFGINPDVAGFWTSLICAIHCSALPILIAFGSVGSHAWLHNHLFDWVIISIGIVIAAYSLMGDYLRGHKSALPLSIASVGFAFLLIGMIDHHGWMLVFSVTGGLMVASSHIVNHRLNTRCKMPSA
jgi:MerC mercury resistance protein